MHVCIRLLKLNGCTQTSMTHWVTLAVKNPNTGGVSQSKVDQRDDHPLGVSESRIMVTGPCIQCDIAELHMCT